MKKTFVYLIVFGIYCALHYIEGFPPLLGLSVAQLWKIPLLVYLLWIFVAVQCRKLTFEKQAVGLSMVTLLNVDILYLPLFNIAQAMKQLSLVLLFRYWVYKYREDSRRVENLLYVSAQFIVLCSLVVLVRLVSPVRDFTSAGSFGVEGVYYYTGLFLAPHAAASYFVAAILTLVYGLKRGRFKTFKIKAFNLFLVCIGLYSLFQTYVRTGWLMLIVGMSLLFFPQRIAMKHIFGFILSLALLLGGGTYLYNTNEQFNARLTGRNIYNNPNAEKIDLEGSGRTAFWKNGIQGWMESEPYEILFGQGNTKVAERNYRETGMRVFSHNQFVQTLSENGLIGFLLLLGFYLHLFRTIQRHKASPYYRLCISLFGAAIIFAFFQNEMYFDYAIIFSLTLANCHLDRSKFT